MKKGSGRGTGRLKSRSHQTKFTMVPFNKASGVALLAAASLLSVQNVSHAAIFAEMGDAGQTLATAENAGNVTGFIGTIGAAQDADLYVFTIAAAGSYRFSDVNTTVDATAGGALDTAIFLFNSTGTPLVTNDDASGTSINSSFTVTLAAGTYYFGISLSGNEPVNSSGQLLFAGYPAGDTTATRGPTSGLNPTTESTFNGQSYSSDVGTYSVSITNAVPEPSTYALLALGGAAVALGSRRLRRQRTA